MESSRITGRPLFLFCSIFFLASVLLADLSFNIKITIAALMLPSAVICTVIGRYHKRLRALFIPLLALALATAVSGTVSHENNTAALLSGNTYECDIVIDNVRGAASYIGYYNATVSSEGNFENVKIMLTLNDGTAVPGDRFRGNVTFFEVTEDDEPYMSPEGIFLSGESEDATYISSTRKAGVGEFFSKLNASLSARLRQHGGGDIGAAVLLGNKDHLATSLSRDFSRLGISHLLALSGLHLSVIVSVADGILSRSNLRKRPRLMIVSVFIIFYMILTGFSASVVRAGTMYLIKTTADFLDRQSDSLTNLSLAAFIILLIDRYACYDVGFILSVLSAYACVTYAMMKNSAKQNKRRGLISRLLRNTADTFLLTIWIIAITLPVMWNVFGQLSLISPLTNVVFIPALTVLLYLSAVTLVFSGVPVIGVLSARVMIAAEKLISVSAEAISQLRGIVVNISLPLIGILSALLFIACVMIPLYRKRVSRVLKITALVAAVSIVITVVTVYAHNANVCTVSFISKGKSEGFLLSHGSTYTLIDVSDGSKGFAYRMYEGSKKMGATEIESLILTHLHKKHVTAVSDLTDRVILRKIILPSPENDDERDVAYQLTKQCGTKGIEVYSYDRSDGETVRSEYLSFSPGEYLLLSRSTHPVISFELDFGGNSFAYAGGSWSENDKIIHELEAAEYAFLGLHHPKTKKFPAIEVNNCILANGVLDDTMKKCLTVKGKALILKEDGQITLPTYRARK